MYKHGLGVVISCLFISRDVAFVQVIGGCQYFLLEIHLIWNWVYQPMHQTSSSPPGKLRHNLDRCLTGAWQVLTQWADLSDILQADRRWLNRLLFLLVLFLHRFPWYCETLIGCMALTLGKNERSTGRRSTGRRSTDRRSTDCVFQLVTTKNYQVLLQGSGEIVRPDTDRRNEGWRHRHDDCRERITPMNDYQWLCYSSAATRMEWPSAASWARWDCQTWLRWSMRTHYCSSPLSHSAWKQQTFLPYCASSSRRAKWQREQWANL